jgi:hypothetical protein
MSNYNIKAAIESALSDADTALENGLLFKPGETPNPETWDDSKGDWETLETIASANVSDGVDDFDGDDSEAETEVYNALSEVYPEH